MKRRTLATAAGLGAAVVVIGAGVAVASGGPTGGPAQVLDDLVQEGTLTQEQADKVGEAFQQRHQERVAEREAMRAEAQQLVADTIGISPEDLAARLAEGETLGEIAGESREELAAVLVDRRMERLQSRFGENATEEQLAEARSRIQERVNARLDGERPGPGERFGGRQGPGGLRGPHEGGPFGGPFGNGTPESSAASTTGTAGV